MGNHHASAACQSAWTAASLGARLASAHRRRRVPDRDLDLLAVVEERLELDDAAGGLVVADDGGVAGARGVRAPELGGNPRRR